MFNPHDAISLSQKTCNVPMPITGVDDPTTKEIKVRVHRASAQLSETALFGTDLFGGPIGRFGSTNHGENGALYFCGAQLQHISMRDTGLQQHATVRSVIVERGLLFGDADRVTSYIVGRLQSTTPKRQDMSPQGPSNRKQSCSQGRFTVRRAGGRRISCDSDSPGTGSRG